jgi:ribosomal subunit interface protein
MVHVACRDTGLSRAGKQWVEEFSTRLERYFTDILTIDWDLTLEGNAHVAICRLHTGAGFYRATARAMDPRQAMHEAIDKLAMQRRREKRVRGSRRRENLQGVGSEAALNMALGMNESHGTTVLARR